MISIDDFKTAPQLKTDHWRSICAVTFTLRQSWRADNGKMIWLDANQCTKAFRVFMHRLDRAVYGNAVIRFEKRVRVIPVLEKDEFGRWHIHAAIELPESLQPFQFEALIRQCWSKVDWAYDHIDFQEYADDGWRDYMLKLRQKSGFEAWSDCIIWECLHNC
jgi:hypothetical protein